MDFSDRFTRIYPTLDPTTIDQLQLNEFNTQFPELNKVTDIVKRHSVLLQNVSRLEVYSAIVDHADPRIGLWLAAARDNAGDQLFGSTTIVKDIMFGESTADTAPTGLQYIDRGAFIDGITRISATLAASLLIGRFAQVPEQQAHSAFLERSAVADLERILQVPELQDLVRRDQRRINDNIDVRSFYFTPGTFTLNDPLICEVFLSGFNSWLQVATYTNSVNTATIAAEVSDTINSLTLNSTTSNLVAAPVLAGENDLHQIKFNSRARDATISSELASIRFNQQLTPFKWGIEVSELEYFALNSLIIATQAGRVSTLSGNSNDQQVQLNVLYFRQLDNVTPTTNDIVYRISPTMDTNATVTIAASTDSRPSDASLALLNDLFETKEANRVLAGIVQNDPNEATPSYSGIYLVAYVVSNQITEYILDLISYPEDLEVSLGNRLGPVTSFSNKPRSITVTTLYDSSLAEEPNTTINESPIRGDLIVANKKSDIVQRIKDIRDAQYISYKPKEGYPTPPFVHNNYFPKTTL